MFRLNFAPILCGIHIVIWFQYFRCFGWIAFVIFTSSITTPCFNTSDVSVEFISCGEKDCDCKCFNTSDVSVEFNSLRKDYLFEIKSFNTSDVSVELITIGVGRNIEDKFQYFRCFGWIIILY